MINDSIAVEELVDVVDDIDQVLYQVTKRYAHEKGLLHRTVICEVIDSEGKWLLVKQASDRQDPGQFVSPIGGHVQAGESVENAMKREALEELGLPRDSFKYKYIGKAIYNRDVRGRHENHYFILYEIHTDQLPTLNHESVACRKFSLDELTHEMNENAQDFGVVFYFVLNEFYPKLKRSSS